MLNLFLCLWENLCYMKVIYSIVGYCIVCIFMEEFIFNDDDFCECFCILLVVIIFYIIFFRVSMLWIFLGFFFFLMFVIINVLKVKFMEIDFLGYVVVVDIGWMFLVIFIVIFFVVMILNLYIMLIYLLNIYIEIK